MQWLTSGDKLKELSLQLLQLTNYTGLAFIPYAEHDMEAAKGYKVNQIVRAIIKGIRKQRSLKQLRTYWRVCAIVASNTDEPSWNTKEKVDYQCRVACRFIDPNITIVLPDGKVMFHYRSISFKNLGHIEACNYFDRAFKVLEEFSSVLIEDLIKNLRR